jgi:hypothetical protein
MGSEKWGYAIGGWDLSCPLFSASAGSPLGFTGQKVVSNESSDKTIMIL